MRRPGVFAFPATSVGLAFSASLLLALASPVSAKGPTSAEVCGASGCRTGNPTALSPIDGRSFSLRKPPSPAPYYAITLMWSGADDICWRLIWVPTTRALRVENLGPYSLGAPIAGRYWRTVHSALVRRLAREVRGVRPYGARRAWRAPKPACS